MVDNSEELRDDHMDIDSG
jgi:hypothetical protein